MSQFRDRHNRQWVIELNIAKAKQVRDAAGVDLLQLKEALAQLQDPVTLVDVLYVCCREQCEKANVSDEDFGAGFTGLTVEAAADALMMALIDFFPPRSGEMLTRVWAMTKSTQEELQKEATAILESGEIDRTIEREVKEILGKLCSEPLAAAGSTPADSQSGR